MNKKSNFTNWIWVGSKVLFNTRRPIARGGRGAASSNHLRSKKYPNKAFVYGALTSNGLSRLLPVIGTAGMRVDGCKGVDAKEYNRVIEDLLVPEGSRLFQGQPFVVVEDGAPAHRSQLVSWTWNKHPHITVK
jgi:hypothetical protein